MDKITIFNKREPRVYLNPKELQDPPTYESLQDNEVFDLSHYYNLLVLKLILIISSVRFIMVNSYLKISCPILDILKTFRLLSNMIRFKFSNLFDNFKVLIENKSGGLKRTFFTLTMIIMVYFLFFSVLPGNERILPFVCAVNECTGGDGDVSSAACTAYGTCGGGPAWSIGGETAPTTCCGDDASENKRTAAAAADSTYTTNAADDGCCTASTDCIQSSTCYDTAVTSAGNYCNAGTWQGGDDSSTACVGLGKTWLADGLSTNSKCCGEDSGEDFEQTAGAGRSVCYNNAVLADGSATGSLLASNGDIYDCGGIASDDSGLGTHVSTGSCTPYEGLYCQTNNTWTSTKPNNCACTANSQCSSSYCDEETGSGLGNDTLVCYAITTCPGGASRCSGYDNTCQVDAGADAVCDDRLPNTCITGGYCDSNCLFKTLNATSGENVIIQEESANSGTATLKQTFAVNSNGQDKFKIFRKKGDKDSFINVANTTTSEYNDTTVEPNQLYYYYIQPVESTINCGGNVSQTVYNISQNTVPPPAPTINAVNTSTFVNLSWNDADPGLELYIPMDNIVGTTVKEWGKNKKRGDSSGATQTTGKYGKGLNFDGNDYLTMTGEAANYSYDQFTVMTWIKRTTDTGIAEIIIDNRDADNDGWLLFVDSNDKLQAQYNTFDAISSDTIPINTWTHVAAAVNSTNIELYIGGILKNTTTKSGSISETADTVIGARSFTSPTNYFNGVIDEIRLYNTSLTQGGVIRDMQAGLITKRISKAINSTANGFVEVGYFNDTNFTDTSATDVAPPNDAAPVSTTHRVGSWSNNPNVTFTWTAPSDNSTVYYYNLTSVDVTGNTNSTIINASVGTGLDGFDLECNQASDPITTTTKEIEETTTTYTCTFPDGANNYFHIRTVDIAGNWYPVNNETGPWGIDTLIPYCSFQNLTVNTTYGYISTNIIYYNNASIGNFSVTVYANDTNCPNCSGISNVTFPTTVSAGGIDDINTSNYYYNFAYIWAQDDTYNSTATITCYDRANNTNTTNFTITLDNAAPSGGSVSYSDGLHTVESVIVTFSDGLDSQSGLNASHTLLLRKSAALSGGSCGSYGSWGQVGSLDPTSPYNDTSVLTDNCYQYQYQVFDNVENDVNYTNANTAKIDTRIPTCSVSSIVDTSAFGYASGTTMYYSSAGTGSFNVAISASSSGGINNVTFDPIPTITGNGSDLSSPYQSTDVGAYSWTTSSTFSGIANATCYSNTNISNTTSYTVTLDTTAPSGGSISYTDGYYLSAGVELTLSDGTDAASGINASNTKILRKSASLINNSCGSYGSWSQIGSMDPSSPYNDTSVSNGNCYQYQYQVFDNVLNDVNYTIANTAKIDTSNPSCSVSSISESSSYAYASGSTVFYNSAGTGSWNVIISAADAEANISNVTFPSLSTLTGSGADTALPYQSTDIGAYSFNTSSTYSNTGTVTCYDVARRSTESTINVTRDITAPSGGYVVYNEANITTTSISLNLYAGNDTQSGLGSSQVQRRAANLIGAACEGTYGDWSNVGSQTTNDISFADTTVVTSQCYQYKYNVYDNVNNLVPYSSSNRVAVNSKAVANNVTIEYVSVSNALDCSALIIDAENSTTRVEWYWYNGSNLKSSGNESTINNNTLTSITSLACGNTSPSEIWNCTVRAFDGMNYGDYSSTTVTIGPGFCFASLKDDMSGANITGKKVIGTYTETAVASDVANSTLVSFLNLSTDASTIKWQGYVGQVRATLHFGTDNNPLYTFDAAVPNGQIESVFASTDVNFNFGTVQPATGNDVDTVYGWDTADSDSASSVYSDTSTTIAGVLVNVANLTAYNNLNNVCNESVSTLNYYYAGAFKDKATSLNQNEFNALAYGVSVRPDYCGYSKDRKVDYQLIVPVNNSGVAGTQTYYLFLDIR